jgi:hypothetical protein
MGGTALNMFILSGIMRPFCLNITTTVKLTEEYIGYKMCI